MADQAQGAPDGAARLDGRDEVAARAAREERGERRVNEPALGREGGGSAAGEEGAEAPAAARKEGREDGRAEDQRVGVEEAGVAVERLDLSGQAGRPQLVPHALGGEPLAVPCRPARSDLGSQQADPGERAIQGLIGPRGVGGQRLHREGSLGPGPGQKKAPSRDGAEEDRRRPTLPGAFAPSTIGAEGLNGSVRNGKRCFPLAITTEIGGTIGPGGA